MRKTLLAKISVSLLFLLFCFLWVILPDRSSPRYKIALIHSYERNYHDAERYRGILEKELSANGVKFEIREFFLDCEKWDYYLELARASYFIDELTNWNADAVAVFNNQAVYSLLKCDNPKLHRIPVVFSGLYCPDEYLIRQYPNVTGYVDIPDYTRTVRMIERIAGSSRIVVMSGSSMIDGRMWMDLSEQCRNANINTYDGDVLPHLLSHRVIEGVREESTEAFENERIDTTVVVRMMSERMPLRIIQQAARGTHTFLMLTSRTFNSMDAAQFFTNPSFAVINEGFGSQDNMLGGYFTPLETQLKEMARAISLRLQGKMPEQQIQQSPKQYVLNWNVLQRYGISAENLPPEYHIMYIPFTVRYRYYILAGSILGGISILSVIMYLMYSLAHERKRKKEALRNLLYEHETLKLAIEGGTTYAWRMKKDNLSFDSHFYKLIAYPHKSVSLDHILAFVHPDDRDRFYTNFSGNGGYARHKGEYRCNFNGEYQWWEFRYNSILNDESGPTVTGLLQNIQEIKDRETELIHARYVAEQAELKQSFLNNMSHEIRTPLNAIVGFSSLLISTPDLSEEEKQEFVNIINSNNDLLLNLINDILELSRIESGSASFIPQEKDLGELLRSYYQTFCVQVKPDIQFYLDIPDEKVMVYVDPMRLQQVVTNFLTNANKFTTTGYIKLGYRYVAGEKSVRIFVEDSGKGIPSDVLEMIFSRFYKHDEFAQGTGLGLSICRSIIERMQGQILVESEEGKGSRFTIVLPLSEKMESV